MVPEELRVEFGHGVRERGSEYFSRGAVRVTESSPALLRAMVAGLAAYQVTLERQGPSLVLFCSCPYFSKNGPCKHLWATILQADQVRWLGSSPAELNVRFAGDEQDEGDEDGQDDDEQEDGHVEAVPPRWGRGAPPARAEWEQLLAEAGLSRRPAPPEVPGTLLYVVELVRMRWADLPIAVVERTVKKDGTPGKGKPARVALSALPSLPDELDRRLLPLLQGAAALGDVSTGYGSFDYETGSRRFASDVAVPVALADQVLPLLAQTGRFFVREEGAAEPIPARYDQGAPWDFLVQVVRPADRAGVELSGVLRRGDETRPLSAALRLTTSGWVVFRGGTIARHRSFGAYGLLASLRQQGRVFVPAADELAFIERLLATHSLPLLELPEDLALREVVVAPRPVLRVGAPDPRNMGPARPTAQLSFQYGSTNVELADGRDLVPQLEQRLLIRRDREAEAGAERRLAALGWKPQQAMWNRPATPGVFQLPASRLPAAVRALVGEGWHVEAEGRLYRRPGAVTFSVASGIDWFDLTATVDFDGVPVSLPALLRALRRGGGMVRLGDGSFGMLPEQWLARYGLLEELGTVEGDAVRFRPSQAGLLDALLAAEPAPLATDERFARAREALATFAGVQPETAPPAFVGKLRPYQQAGLGWLSFLRRFGFGGCLADDMGLGKTVQVLAMLAGRSPRSRGGPKQPRRSPSLVVVPKSLVWNWRQEAARFAPSLRVVAHVGAERAQDAEALLASGADLVVTTYGTMRNDAPWLRAVEFDYLILDEAQAIKNEGSESAKAARLLRGEHRLALSGTPIENHLGELWSLFEFLNPGMLGGARAFEGLLGKGRPDPETLAVLRRALRPFILRRTKEEVAPELPPKHQETIVCELEPAQRRLYDELRGHYRARLLRRISSEGLGKAKIQVLEALLRLRQAATHPGLIDPARASEPSAKLDVLLPRLHELRDEGHKALVFSQFTSFLAILRARLDAEGLPYEYLDGEVAMDERQRRVARFQQPDSGLPLFLISLKAGGLGLNLTAADYVFILDPWWNPAVEAQAIDRAHRIGQDKRVFVYRLLCRETVEEKVAALQEAKRGLADSIIEGATDGGLMRELDRETLELLLS